MKSSVIEVDKLDRLLLDKTYSNNVGKYKIEPLLKAYANLISVLPKQKYNTADEFTRVSILKNSVSFDRFCFKKKITDSLIQLGNAILEASKNSYEQGKAEGKRTLIMLNSGEITLNDFEK